MSLQHPECEDECLDVLLTDYEVWCHLISAHQLINEPVQSRCWSGGTRVM